MYSSLMEANRKTPTGKPYSSNVTFVVPTIKRLDGHTSSLDGHQPLIMRQPSCSMRQDSLGVVSQSSLAAGVGGRRESTLGLLMAANKSPHVGGLSSLDTSQSVVRCHFQTRWKILSYLQIIFGVLAIIASLFSKDDAQ